MRLRVKSYRSGFGLIEVLISLTIITVLLASLVSVGKTMLSGSLNVQEKAQAVRLAEEGLEMVRQIRDTGWTDGNNQTEWDTLVYAQGIPAGAWSAVTVTGSYGIGFDDVSHRIHLVELAALSDGDEIRIDNAKFYRKIEVEDLGELLPAGPDGQDIAKYGKKFTARVLMPNGREIAVSEILTNWRPAW